MRVLFVLLAVTPYLVTAEVNPYADEVQCTYAAAVNVSQLYAMRYHHTRKLENVQAAVQEVNKAENLLNISIKEIEKLDVVIERMAVPETIETSCTATIPKDCCEIKTKFPAAKSGMYTIRDPCSGTRIYSTPRMTVYCDMETDGGGWIVIQRRNASMGWVKFNRKWSDYEKGFGDLDGEFWIGLKNIYELTKQERMVLQLSAWNQSDIPTVKANCNSFRLYDANNRYAMASLGSVTATSGYTTPFYSVATSSTYFQTYDYYAGQSKCPYKLQNGWWYYYGLIIRGAVHNSNCGYYSNLNGLHQPSGLRGTDQRGERLHWKTTSGVYNTFTNSEMKIRPNSCTLR